MLQFRALLMPHQYEPFNGDTFVQEEFVALRDKFGLENAIETGTCLGSTTKWLSEVFGKVYTIEVNQEYLDFAKLVFAERKNIQAYLGSSEVMLAEILKHVDSKTMVFLDAHWGEHCPLEKELQAIADANLKPVIAIHDFLVPNEPALGCDYYKGHPFTFEWLKPCFDAVYGEGNYAYHYNSDDRSTDIKRGLIYVYPIV